MTNIETHIAITLLYMYAVLSGAFGYYVFDRVRDKFNPLGIFLVLSLSPVFAGLAFILGCLYIALSLLWKKINGRLQLTFFYQWYFTKAFDDLPPDKVELLRKYQKAYLNKCNNKPPYLWRVGTKMINDRYKITLD